jgi:hypothetical protein
VASRWAWLFGVALVALPVAIAIGAPKRGEREEDEDEGEGGMDGTINPFANTGEEDENEDPYRTKLPEDTGDCLVLGKEHAFHKFGSYRVCLTDNQKATLFKKRKGKKLGCGVFACAYATSSPTKVVKFTRDSEDVAALLEAQDTDVVPKVYASYKIKDGGHSIRTDEETPVYALVVEKLKTFTPAEREALDAELHQVSDLMREVDTGEANSIAEACESREQCSPITRQTAEAAYALRHAGIEWSDIHSGNIGMDKHGNIKILDLGITGTQLKEEPKILAGALTRLARHRLAGI